MRALILCLLFLCIGCSAVTHEKERTFQDAQLAFDAGNYRQAAAMYGQLLEQGVRSGAVYYNLGNAWAKADEPVNAIAAYYLAKRYIPNDSRLNTNLSTVLKNNGGTPPPSDSSLMGSILFWQDWIGTHAKIWISIVLSALTFLGGTLCLFQKNRRQCHRSTIALAILTTIALVSVGYDWYRFEWVAHVIVTKDVVPRKGNSEQYEPAFVSPIPFGTLAVILDERAGWVSLRFPNGQEGWLPQSQTFLIREQTTMSPHPRLP